MFVIGPEPLPTHCLAFISGYWNKARTTGSMMLDLNRSHRLIMDALPRQSPINDTATTANSDHPSCKIPLTSRNPAILTSLTGWKPFSRTDVLYLMIPCSVRDISAHRHRI